MNLRLLATGLIVLLGASAASAQFDLNKLSKALDTAKDASKMLKGVAGIGPAEEKVIGDSVALEIVGRYGGLVRDEAITQRVMLVGRSLARYSDRPGLDWRFGVLDSPTVNAFSAPDGYVFITRGLYDLAENDDILAAILSHEIAHITGRHALKIVARGEFLSGATSLAAARSGEVRKVDAQLKQFNLGVEQITKTLFEKGFDPQTEYGADKEGRHLAVTTGYAPGSLRLVLQRLQARTGDPKAIFSTHPPLAERIKRLPAESAMAPAAATHAATGSVSAPAATAADETAAIPGPTTEEEIKAAVEELDDDDRAFMEAAEKPKKKKTKAKPAQDPDWEND
jgi:predicted Zn-dependent protease